MRFTSESVMHEIETALRQRSSEDWTDLDRLLLKAQLHIAGLQRELDNTKMTLTNRQLRTYDGKYQ
jgi:hypothetical protein